MNLTKTVTLHKFSCTQHFHPSLPSPRPGFAPDDAFPCTSPAAPPQALISHCQLFRSHPILQDSQPTLTLLRKGARHSLITLGLFPRQPPPAKTLTTWRGHSRASELQPMDQTQPSTCFVNKALLGYTHARHLQAAGRGCLHAPGAEPTGCPVAL